MGIPSFDSMATTHCYKWQEGGGGDVCRVHTSCVFNCH